MDLQNKGGSYDFAARPQLINRPGPHSNQLGGPAYRDPYREYVKVAPQNIMYDRRVVRGNTFAALVIPVNMQPDPQSPKKEMMKQIANRNRLQKLKEQRVQQQLMEQQQQVAREAGYDQQDMPSPQQRQYMSPQKHHDWVPLDDEYNMVDETSIPRDYFIDKPPTAQYVPEAEGNDKAIQLNEIQEGLFDFDLECEPILQVLIGKALEHAQIEVIEGDEDYGLKKAKDIYKQKKEAMLMNTQRKEAGQDRRTQEVDRRNLQFRTNMIVETAREKRQIASVFSKQFLVNFKTENLQALVDLGCLRSRRELSMETQFLPQLHTQIIQDMLGLEEEIKDITELVSDMAERKSTAHKEAIMREFKRRDEKANEGQKGRDEAVAAKSRRQERRKCMREQVRVQEISETIMEKIIPTTTNHEYTISMPIYDVRDYAEGKPNGVCTFGGFIGEMLLTLSSIEQSILKKDESYGFKFDSEKIQAFLNEMFVETGGYPVGICGVKIQAEPLTKEEEEESEAKRHLILGTKLTQSYAHKQFGLKFLLDTAAADREFGVGQDLISEFFTAIVNIHYKKEEELVPVPEEDPSKEEQDPKLEEKQEAANSQNEEITTRNENLQKLKTFVKLCQTSDGGEEFKIDEWDEKAFAQVKNYREVIIDEHGNAIEVPVNTGAQLQSQGTVADKKSNAGRGSQMSMKDDVSETASAKQLAEYAKFEYDSIPRNVIMLAPWNEKENLTLMVQHTEAPFAIRKAIAEKAKACVKELKEINVMGVVGRTADKQKILETNFNQVIDEQLGWKKGDQHEDHNLTITFNTFLLKDDPRLEGPTRPNSVKSQEENKEEE